MPDFYEFFSGGGMARAGLGAAWRCLFANDCDPKKAASYIANWGAGQLLVEDVAALTTADLPGTADLAWASFPCQDLSLAGVGAGLQGKRSGTFWPFWRLMQTLDKEGRAPRLIVLENVCGALGSNAGADFAALASALLGSGYRFGALIINAVHFLPQSRPRLFMIGAHQSLAVSRALVTLCPHGRWHPAILVDAYNKLPTHAQNAWHWWCLPVPPMRTSTFADLLQEEPQGVAWHMPAETRKLLDMMNPLNLAKVHAAQKSGKRQVGAVYKRTRSDGTGGKRMQRAEIRFDDIAGCLRTPTGGSSRQIIMVIDGAKIRSRLLSPREAARLMGLADTYALPQNYNDAYHLTGDGVAVPVVRFLAEHLLEPLLAAACAVEKQAA